MQSEALINVTKRAKEFVRQGNYPQLKAHHILYAMKLVDNEAKPYLDKYGISRMTCPPVNDGTIAKNSELELTLLGNITQKIAVSMNDAEINCIHLLLAMLSMKKSYVYGVIEYWIQKTGKTPDELFFEIKADLPNGASLRKIAKAPKQQNGSASSDRTQAQTLEYPRPAVSAQTTSSAMQIPYGFDMTQRALSGGYDPVIGRDTETERVIQTLTRRTKNNPVLVGEAGVGKTAVVEGLALCIAEGRVPAQLQNMRLIQLDMAGMLAGTRYRGDFEERLTEVVDQVTQAGDVLLFIDEIHNLVGAGSAEGSMDAAEILKPALARGELHIIGATTTREYRLYIEKDPALERRFQPITVDEPSPELAVEILKGVKAKYEKHHGVTISDDAIETAVQLSVRYVTDRFLPDKAFDIIDEACSKLKIEVFKTPRELTTLSGQLNSLRRKIEQARWEQGTNLRALEEQYADTRREYDRLYAEYQAQNNSGKCVLTGEYVRLVVSQMTGVPVAELSVEEKDKLVHLEEELGRRVIGQKEAVQVVARAVRRQRAGLKDPNRPIGSFIFVGPTGVGKTELAKALSDCLFGTNSDIVRIDMSEYMDKTSVAKLIGAPPGYVGYDESGYLTEKVLRRPYSVVLFDEIEKAHPDVFNLLLQILDEGRLTDSHGKTVDFRNTVIILTSNIGVSDGNSGTIGFGSASDYRQMQSNIDRALHKFFRPEFLNRLDEIVTFSYLGRAEIIQIAKLMCVSLHKRLQGTVNLKFTESAISTLAEDGYDRNFGARPLKRTIQRNVEDALAEKLLTGEINKGDNVLVDSIGGEIIFYRR